MTLLLLLACDGFTFTENPPVIEQAGLDCDAGELDLDLVLSDDNAVTNVLLESGESQWLPDWVAGDRISTWTLQAELDCELPHAFTLEVWNAMGLSTTIQLSWPLEPPEGGSVEPAFGSEIGGSEVLLTGEGLALVDRVLFGGEEADILARSDDALTLLTPAHEAGAVDLELFAGEQASTLEAAFTYHADATGLASGFARPTLFRYDPRWFTIGSPYAQLSTYGPFVQVDLALIAPVEDELTFVGSMPEIGSCSWSEHGYDSYGQGSYLLMSGDVDYALTTTDWLYTLVLDGVDPEEWDGVSYDLDIPTSSEQLPAQRLEGALVFPTQVELSADWQATNPHTVGEDLVLGWVDDGLLDGLLYSVYLVRSNWSVLRSWSCAVASSDEEVLIPWSELVDGVDADQASGIIVVWNHWEDTRAPLAHDNSHFWSRGILQTWTWHPLVAQ